MTPAEGTDPAAEGAGDEDAGEDKPEPKPKKQGDPNSVDLAAIEDFGRVTGTSDEVWDQMVADMELWMDPWAGKKGNDARDRLVELGYRAMPVIMNGFKGLDLSTEEGHSNGNVIQRALTDLAHGINFGWKSYDDEGALYYNKKVVENFCTQWRKARTTSTTGSAGPSSTRRILTWRPPCGRSSRIPTSWTAASTSTWTSSDS